MKTVKIASSRWDSTKQHSTSATTWGELKSELGNDILNYEGSPMKAILRSVSGERNTLSDSNTLLPREDFSLLLVPTKVKSGYKEVYSADDFKKLRAQMNKVLGFMASFAEDQGEIIFTDGDETEGLSAEDAALLQEAKEAE